MPIEKMKPIHVFLPIERIDEETRTVDAYGFVNEVVEGENGMELLRASMEAATPDMMKWANVREMHVSSAVGTVDSTTWDKKGARMILKVEDDNAWKKVRTGVYKGLSVGVIPQIIRGKRVEKCRWYETSLVDRPKDPDAKILAFRAEGVGEETEFDCEVEPEEALLYVRADEFNPDGMLLTDAIALMRTLASGDVPSRENLEGKPKAVTHYDCGADYGCHGHTTRGGAIECMDRIADDKDAQMSYHQQQIDMIKAKRVELGDPVPEPKTVPLERFTTLETETETALNRAATAETELAIERAARAAAEERVKALEQLPARRSEEGPVRYPQAMQRTFTANEDDPETRKRIGVAEEIQRLQSITPETEPDAKKRAEAAQRMIYLRMQLGI